jgi:hypothetical protein
MLAISWDRTMFASRDKVNDPFEPKTMNAVFSIDGLPERNRLPRKKPPRRNLPSDWLRE